MPRNITNTQETIAYQVAYDTSTDEAPSTTVLTMDAKTHSNFTGERSDNFHFNSQTISTSNTTTINPDGSMSVTQKGVAHSTVNDNHDGYGWVIREEVDGQTEMRSFHSVDNGQNYNQVFHLKTDGVNEVQHFNSQFELF